MDNWINLAQLWRQMGNPSQTWDRSGDLYERSLPLQKSTDCHIMTLVLSMSSISSSSRYLHTCRRGISPGPMRRCPSAPAGWEHSSGPFKSDINISTLVFCGLTNIATQGLYLNEFEIINLAEVIYVTSISFSMLTEPKRFRRKRFALKLLSDGACMCDLSSVKTSLSNSCHTWVSRSVYDETSPPGADHMWSRGWLTSPARGSMTGWSGYQIVVWNYPRN